MVFEKHYQLGFEFINSPEYQQIVGIGQQITNLIEPTGFWKRVAKKFARLPALKKHCRSYWMKVNVVCISNAIKGWVR